MKAMKLIYLPLLVIFVTTIDATGKPCSTSGNLPVVNICTANTTLQDNHGNSVLIKADTMRNCTCELSVRNQNNNVTVNMQKFGQENSSSPLAFNCGLELKFDIGTDTIWKAQCKVADVVISKKITINTKIIIRSVTVIGTLQPNEGYCIEMKKDNDDTTVLGVGASIGGLVIILIGIAVIYIYRRNHSKSATKPASKQEGLAVNNDNDDYGLRENVLYIPTDSTPLQTNYNLQNTNRISVDIDGNYSTVDVNEIPSVEESTGNYTSIDLKKRTTSESNLNGSKNEKPIIAPKPKQKETIQDYVYSVPDKKRVKHVKAPGEDMCEYYVVSKTNVSSVDKCEDQHSAINVYAVVEKKKCLSDGKDRNQKRHSFTADEDGEKD